MRFLTLVLVLSLAIGSGAQICARISEYISCINKYNMDISICSAQVISTPTLEFFKCKCTAFTNMDQCYYICMDDAQIQLQFQSQKQNRDTECQQYSDMQTRFASSSSSSSMASASSASSASSSASSVASQSASKSKASASKVASISASASMAGVTLTSTSTSKPTATSVGTLKTSNGERAYSAGTLFNVAHVAHVALMAFTFGI